MADSHTTSTPVSREQKLDGAHALRGLILRHRARPDEARQLAHPVVEAMGRLGVARPQCRPHTSLQPTPCSLLLQRSGFQERLTRRRSPFPRSFAFRAKRRHS
jgi:hypothetical protein